MENMTLVDVWNIIEETGVIALLITLLFCLVFLYALNKCEKGDWSYEEVLKTFFVIFSITILILTWEVVYNNYTLPKYKKQEKIIYRDIQLSKLSKGELDCNLIYTNEDIYFELSQEEQLQYYTGCKVIQESNNE